MYLQKGASSICFAAPELTSGHGGRNLAYQTSTGTDLNQTQHTFTRDQYLVNDMAQILILYSIYKKSIFL